ncbi:MAG TPA: bifunctional DNA primase/polymerase [Terriglobia bacterium]|nr:bifunctional DNA primase/polymerase [Terriglobia bacterium]
MNPRLRAALNYARRGWPVLPCAPDGTAISEDGACEASADEAVVRAWWTRWPRANIGTTGVVVLDVTGREGERTLAALEGKYGELPETRVVGTAQGRQIHFLPNGAAVPSDGGKLGPHVNVLGASQSVLLPPSADESGVRCEWLPLMQPVPLPGWVAQALIAPETQQEKALAAKQDVTPAPIGKLEAAKRFLQEALGNGAAKSETIERQAVNAGFSKKTIYRARNIMGVEVKKVGFGAGQHWEWRLLEGRTTPKVAKKVVKKKVKKAIFESLHGTLRNQPEASGFKAGENGGLYGAIPPPFPDAEWQPDAQKGLQ